MDRTSRIFEHRFNSDEYKYVSVTIRFFFRMPESYVRQTNEMKKTWISSLDSCNLLMYCGRLISCLYYAYRIQQAHAENDITEWGDEMHREMGMLQFRQTFFKLVLPLLWSDIDEVVALALEGSERFNLHDCWGIIVPLSSIFGQLPLFFLFYFANLVYLHVLLSNSLA